MRSKLRPGCALFCVSLLVAFGSGCTQQARLHRHLEKANHDFAAGLFDAAEVEYLNVLQSDAANPDAISGLAIIYFDQGRFGRALPLLLKARELRPEDLNLRRKLGELMLNSGQRREARDEAIFILAHRPNDAEAPLLLAESATEAKEIAEAQKTLGELGPATVDTAPVLVALGMLDAKQKKFSEAEEKLNRAASLKSQSSVVAAALGALYSAKHDLPRAEKAFAEAGQLAPDRSLEKLKLPRFQIQNGKNDLARNELQEIVHKTPDYLPAWLLLGEIALAENKNDEAGVDIAKVLARDPNNSEALLSNGRLHLAQNDPEKAEADFESMLRLYPKDPEIHYQLALAQLAANKSSEAIESLHQALALSPNLPEAVVLLAGINIQKNDFNAAILPLKALLQEHPEMAQPRLLLAGAYRGLHLPDQALEEYKKLDQLFPGNPETIWLEGLADLDQADKKPARQAFEEALKLNPNYLPAVEQLVRLDLSEKNYQGAEKRVDEQLGKTPRLADLYLLREQVSATQGDLPGAEEAEKKALELRPNLAAAPMLLAKLYLQTHQLPQALARLTQVLSIDPKNREALIISAEIQAQAGNYPAARDEYEKLRAIDPSYPNGLNNLAYLYADKLNDLDKAYELAQKARQYFPNDPNVADTFGWILYKKHQFPWALTILQGSATQLSQNAEAVYHLGMAHYMMGEEAPARTRLQNALKLNPDFPGATEAKEALALIALDSRSEPAATTALLQKRLSTVPDDPVALSRRADLYLAQQNSQKAIETYHTALDANPKNVAILLKLTELYIKTGDFTQAIATATTARKLAPDDGNVTTRLGNLALQAGDYSWATSLLQSRAASQPKSPALLIKLGEAIYGAGRVDDGVALVRRALEAPEALPPSDEAKHFIELIGLQTTPHPSPNQTELMTQLSQGGVLQPVAIFTQGRQAELGSDFTTAQNDYETLLRKTPNFIPAVKRLASLYITLDREPKKAYDLAKQAAIAFPNDPELLQVQGIALFRQADFSAALAPLQTASEQRKTNGEAAFYLGMTEYQLKQYPASRRDLERARGLKLPTPLATETEKTLLSLETLGRKTP